MKTSASKKTNINTATSPYTVQIASDVEVLTFYNNKTLSANFAIQASGTPATDTTITMLFTGSITAAGNTFSIFGVNLDADVIKNPFYAICYYTNTNWSVLYGNLKSTSIATGGGIGVGGGGGIVIETGGILNAMVNAAAGIAYSKLALTGSIVNADISPSAAVAYSKLALAGAILNSDINAAAAIAYSKLALTGGIVNTDINAAAAIAFNKMAALTASRILQTDGSGVVTPVDTATYPTLTELSYVKGLTSTAQTQITAKAEKTYVDAADSVLAASVAAINPSVKTRNPITGTTVLTAATIKNNLTLDVTGGGFTTTLPLISTIPDGYEVLCACVGHISNVAVIACNASDHIVNQDNTAADVSSLSMAGYYKSYRLQADHATSTWYVVQKT